MLNRQLVFDTVCSHLLRQGKPSMVMKKSVSDVTICAYRGKGGLKCAVGVLIDDNLYKKSFEGNGVYSLPLPFIQKDRYGDMDESNEEARGFTDKGFLATLQSIHDDRCDSPTFVNSCIKGLSDFAANNNLNPFVLVNCVRALIQSATHG